MHFMNPLYQAQKQHIKQMCNISHIYGSENTVKNLEITAWKEFFTCRHHSACQI